MKNVKKNSDTIKNTEEIEKEASKIYPDVEGILCDNKINDLYKVKDWSEIFFYGKTKLMKERFLNIISKSEYSKFFEGLNYEYGINNKPKDIQMAFDIYKEQADNSTDILSMLKMYFIYKNEFKNFGLKKRDKILEKFYLFKCYSYLTKRGMDVYYLLFNRFFVKKLLRIHFEYEDNEQSKFDKLIQHLNKYIIYYNIKKDDLLLIESVITFKFKKNQDDKIKSLETLKNLSKKNNLESIYKLAIFTENEESEKYFEILEKNNYYRSFCDYAKYLLVEKNNLKKAIELLSIAVNNGVIKANFFYYEVLLSNMDFSKKNEINKKFKDNIILLFNLIINDICTDSIYSYFEYFFLRKLCIKYWNLKSLINDNFLDYTKDFIKVILDNACSFENKEEIKSKKEKILNIYFRTDFYSEYHLTCGILYYYGIENIVNVDLIKSLSKFQISFDNSDSKSYQRFCYSYISRIKQKLYDNNKLITFEENNKSQHKLFDLYYSSIDKYYLDYLSSSFYYYLSRLYLKSWGTPQNEIMEYICLERASSYINKSPGNGTIICYYRKYKSNVELEKKKKLYLNNFKEMFKSDSEGYGDDGSICPICMENKRNIMLLPCKHLFCKTCTDQILKKGNCPICRGLIIFNFDFEKIKNESNNIQ